MQKVIFSRTVSNELVLENSANLNISLYVSAVTATKISVLSVDDSIKQWQIRNKQMYNEFDNLLSLIHG